jgi:RinA family phage transcriptional activator
LRTALQKANEKLIEAEIRNYKQTKQDLADLREEIIEGTSYQEVAVQTSPGNNTYNKACRLMTSRQILECERRVKAIEYAVEVLQACSEPKKYELMNMKYWEHEYTDYGIMQRLAIEKTTFYRWKKEILQLIAERLGWQI